MTSSTTGTKRAKSKPLTDAERHKRFVSMAREVKASDDPKAFDKAFKKVAPTKAVASKSPKR